MTDARIIEEFARIELEEAIHVVAMCKRRKKYACQDKRGGKFNELLWLSKKVCWLSLQVRGLCQSESGKREEDG